MAKYGSWLITYGTCSTVLFFASLYSLISKAFDYFGLIHELTYSFHFTILLNFVAFCFLLWGILSTRLLFGNLRVIETDHLMDKLPFFALNLLFILFNDDNVLLGVFWGGATILIKVYHIVALDRLDYLQVTTVNKLNEINTPALIFRTFASSKFVWYIALFIFLDVLMAKLLVFDVFQGVSSVCSLLYGIQFAVMALDNLSYMWKLSLNLYELMYYRCPPAPSTPISPPSTESLSSVQEASHQNSGVDQSTVDTEGISIGTEDEFDPENEEFSDDEDDETERVWDNKPIYAQTLEIMSLIIKSMFYVIFSYMLYVHSNITPPLPMLQGGVMSILRVFSKTKTFFSFLSNARRLENHLVDALVDDLHGSGHMCIICRDNMHLPQAYQAHRNKPLSPRKHPKKLDCGHILHMGCLKDWLERSTMCPLCRKPVFPSTLVSELEPVVEAPEAPNDPEANAGPRPTLDTHQNFQQGLNSTNRAREGINVLPTPTTQEFLGTGNNEIEQEVPTIPNGWQVLPLSGNGPHEFGVRLSAIHAGTLSVRENTREVSFYRLESL